MSNNQRVYTITFVDGRTDTGHETHSAALTAASADGAHPLRGYPDGATVRPERGARGRGRGRGSVVSAELPWHVAHTTSCRAAETARALRDKLERAVRELERAHAMWSDSRDNASVAVARASRDRIAALAAEADRVASAALGLASRLYVLQADEGHPETQPPAAEDKAGG